MNLTEQRIDDHTIDLRPAVITGPDPRDMLVRDEWRSDFSGTTTTGFYQRKTPPPLKGRAPFSKFFR